MKKSIAMKWVRALRSGEYKQGMDFLYNEEEDTYCCLGVLCSIEGIKSKDIGTILSENKPIKTSRGRIPSLTTDLTVLNDIGYVEPYDGTNTPPLTFDEIADIIQINYKEL